MSTGGITTSPPLPARTTPTSRVAGGGKSPLGKVGAAVTTIAPLVQAAAPYVKDYLSSSSRNGSHQPASDTTQSTDSNVNNQDESAAKQLARSGFDYLKSQRRQPTDPNLYRNSHLNMDDMLAGATGATNPYMPQSQTPYSDAVMSQIGMAQTNNMALPMMLPPEQLAMLNAQNARQVGLLGLASLGSMMGPQALGGIGGPQAFGGTASGMAPYMSQLVNPVTNGIAPTVPQTQFTTTQFSPQLQANAELYKSLTPDMRHSQIAQAQGLRTTIDVLSGGAPFGLGAFGGGFGAFGGGFGGGIGPVGSPFTASQIGVPGTPYY